MTAIFPFAVSSTRLPCPGAAAKPHDPTTLMRFGKSTKEVASPRRRNRCEEAIKLNPNLLAPAVDLAELNAGPLQTTRKLFDLLKSKRARTE
jgi:hypothetical protein